MNISVYVNNILLTIWTDHFSEINDEYATVDDGSIGALSRAPPPSESKRQTSFHQPPPAPVEPRRLFTVPTTWKLFMFERSAMHNNDGREVGIV